MSERVRIIDIAKGITIVGVAFTHSHLENSLPGLDHALALFRMPLFFFLAGIFFNEAIELGNLVFRKTDSLLKPYFVTLGALLLIDIMLESQFQSVWELKGILYGNGETIKWVASWATPLWFLTHLWVLFIFSYLIFSVTKIQTKPCYLKVLLVFLLLTTGAAMVDEFWHLPININGRIVEIPGLPFSLDLVFISAAYFISGRFLREHVKSFKPTHETAWADGPIPKRTRQNYSLQDSLRLGFTGSALPGGDQSYRTVWSGYSFEQDSQTTSKIESLLQAATQIARFLLIALSPTYKQYFSNGNMDNDHLLLDRVLRHPAAHVC
jgi:Acyltransferase family